MAEVACRLGVHEFSLPVKNMTVHYYVIRLKDSYFLWIGNSPAKFSDLSMAMSTNYVSCLRACQSCNTAVLRRCMFVSRGVVRTGCCSRKEPFHGLIYLMEYSQLVVNVRLNVPSL